MHVTNAQLHALHEAERFLRKMTTWALPPNVRAELDALLAAYDDSTGQPDRNSPSAAAPLAPVVKLAMSSASTEPGPAKRFPGNLRDLLPEWAASGPNECPLTPFDIKQALERVKVVGWRTSWDWFHDAVLQELGGLRPDSAIAYFDGAEALRQLLWWESHPRFTGDAPLRRVAFLGIDGVLFPNASDVPDSYESLKSRVDANEAVRELVDCLDSGGLDVVVHSIWRTRLTRPQLLELFGMADGGFGGDSGCAFCNAGSFLVGTTLSTLDGAAGIHDAVARMRLGADDYIVIDPDAKVLAACADQAVPCDSSRGIDSAFVDALYERLGVNVIRV